MQSARYAVCRRGVQALAAATAAGACLCAPGPAAAQVLEIGARGVTVYDAPAVYDRQGATPIAPPAPPPRVARHAHVDAAAISDAAGAAELSPDLVEAVAWRESRLRPRVVSRAGAVGEMQLMPGTARAMGVDPADTRANFRGGAAYLRVLMKRYDGDVVRALSAYNAGPGAVERYGGTPPYKETQAYVAAVLERLSQRAVEEGEAK